MGYPINRVIKFRFQKVENKQKSENAADIKLKYWCNMLNDAEIIQYDKQNLLQAVIKLLAIWSMLFLTHYFLLSTKLEGWIHGCRLNFSKGMSVVQGFFFKLSFYIYYLSFFTNDFLFLLQGKNAIFRAVVKGEPKPEVVWKRNNKDIDDPQKFQINFSPATNEFILQVRINY